MSFPAYVYLTYLTTFLSRRVTASSQWFCRFMPYTDSFANHLFGRNPKMKDAYILVQYNPIMFVDQFLLSIRVLLKYQLKKDKQVKRIIKNT